MDCQIQPGHVKQLVHFFESQARREKETRLTLRSNSQGSQSDKKENRPAHIIRRPDGENTARPSPLTTISNLIKPCVQQGHFNEETLFSAISKIITDKLDRLYSERCTLLQVVPLVSPNNEKIPLDIGAPGHICFKAAEMPASSSSQHVSPKLSRQVNRPRRASKIPIRISGNKNLKNSKSTTKSQLFESTKRHNDSTDVNMRRHTIRFDEDVSLHYYNSQSPIVHKIPSCRHKKTLKIPLKGHDDNSDGLL
ncbi:uncharacterized protein LOC126905755 [Daktulosphaira vitifoliae]|uniref:uncharacterized protein LOC126905755 n=1 Tax=Daktulosphaira vitifoliae TaxID=58002 RepID=UPI0021A9C265|nr:uncharacterized protein LOC126905755 [Daktulosphaira vitifoliae]